MLFCVLWLSERKNTSINIFITIPYLKTSILSPLNLLVSTVVKQHSVTGPTHVLVVIIINMHVSITGHKVTLMKDQRKLDIRKYSFSQRTLIELNSLWKC